MLKPHHIQADRLMEMSITRPGRRYVNRRYCPPLADYATLIKKGYLAVGRDGLPSSRTTYVELTDKGLAEVAALARHYERPLHADLLARIAAGAAAIS